MSYPAWAEGLVNMVNFLKFWREEKERDEMGDKHMHTNFYESASVKWWIIISVKKYEEKK